MLKATQGSAGAKARFTASPATPWRFRLRPLARSLALGVGLSLALVACAEEEESAVAAPDIEAGKSLAETHCVGCHGSDGRGAAPGIPNLAAQVDQYLVEALLAYKEEKRTHAALRDISKELSGADIRNVAGYYAGLPPLKDTAEVKPPEVLSPYEKGEAAAAVRAYLYGKRGKSSLDMLRELTTVDLESVALYFARQTPLRRKAPSLGDPASGEPLSARCGGCHGAHGVSNDTATPSLAGQEPEYLVAAIKAYRDQSRRHDVMLDQNTDQEIEHLAAYYATQESKAAESETITVRELADKCDRCHGPEAETPTMAVPKISGQDRDYLIRALRAYRDGKRGSSMMHNMSMPYSETIMESISSLYANQPAR
jgi:cytochrome c553